MTKRKPNKKIFNRYLGLDLSLNGTGFCVIDDEYNILESGRIDPKTRREMERIDFIRNNLYQYFSCDYVGIEDMAYGVRNSSSLTKLGELNGVIKFTLYKEKKDYILIAPTQVKKFITGKGNANKDILLMYVYKKYGIEFENSDECDSFILAKITKEVYNEHPKLLTYEKEVVKQVRKSNF